MKLRNIAAVTLGTNQNELLYSIKEPGSKRGNALSTRTGDVEIHIAF